jgi:hypothetical protein
MPVHEHGNIAVPTLLTPLLHCPLVTHISLEEHILPTLAMEKRIRGTKRRGNNDGNYS